MGISERQKEIKRRRSRRAKLKKLKAKLEKSSDDREQRTVAERIRRISPDALPADL
jgi:hypothetical protein